MRTNNFIKDLNTFKYIQQKNMEIFFNLVVKFSTCLCWSGCGFAYIWLWPMKIMHIVPMHMD